MRRIPIAFVVMSLVLVTITATQIFIYSTFNELNNIIYLIENEEDANKHALTLKTTYAQRHRWLMMISDNNLILQLKMVIDTLDHEAEPDEILAHTNHIKSELMRVESLLLALL